MTVVVVAVVIVLAVATIAFVTLTSQSSTSRSPSTSSTSSTATSSKSSGGSSTTSSTTSASGLSLQITLNDTTVEAGSPLTAQVSLFNTLTGGLSLSANYSANPNIANWDLYDTLCGLSSVGDTFGFALFQGHYAAGNLSQAGSPMLLTPPWATSCPNRSYNQAYIQNVEFAPDSSVATLSSSSPSSTFEPQAIGMMVDATTGSCKASPYSATVTEGEDGTTTTSTGTQYSISCGSNGGSSLYGYWTAPANGGYVTLNGASNSTATAGMGLIQSYFHQFAPGSYTIVAEDMWNQTVYAHFQVTEGVTSESSSSTSSASTSTTTSSSQAPTESLIQIPVTSASTSNSSLEIGLVMHLSASGPSGGNLTIGLSAVNLLNSTRAVPYANDWAYPQGGLTENDYCAFPDSLAFGIFSGNLSLSNYMTGNPLPLHDTNVQRSCTRTLVPTSFAPLGNESVGQAVTGYWTGGINTSTQGVFMTFPSGVYTVIGVDEWGQVLLLHFVVPGAATTTSGSGGTTSTTSTTSSSPTSTLTTSATTTSAATTSPATASGTAATTQLGPTLTGASSSISATYILQIAVTVAVISSVALMRPRGAKKRGASV